MFGQSTQDDLLTAAGALRTAAWARQHALGADWLPSNDFGVRHCAATAEFVMVPVDPCGRPAPIRV